MTGETIIYKFDCKDAEVKKHNNSAIAANNEQLQECKTCSTCSANLKRDVAVFELNGLEKSEALAKA